jgi:ATP-dependent DNA helicase RecG
LCAFLNASGGTVIIGVTPNGQIVGQQVSDKTQQEIAALLQKFEPPAPVSIERVRLPSSNLELIVLQASPLGEALPFTFDGRPYQRIGTTTSIMPQDRYQTLLLERTHSKQRWENAVVEGVEITDLDQEEILRTVHSGVAAGRLPELIPPDPLDILQRLGLSLDDKILNGAIVLFGKRFLPYYPQCELRLARFKGIKKQEFMDTRQIRGHAFDLLAEAILFLQRHLPTRARIESGRLERVETLLVPLEALREVLVNALIHRRYTDPGGAVSVAIYDDRIEVASDGPLPFGLTPKDLVGQHFSRPRNPLIAEVFYKRGLIEKWGRGTNRVIEACANAGLPVPEFAVIASNTVVTFHAQVGAIPILSDRRKELGELDQRVLRAIGQDTLRLSQIADRLGPPVPQRTLRRVLAQLKDKGFVESIGKARATVYRLVPGRPVGID